MDRVQYDTTMIQCLLFSSFTDKSSPRLSFVSNNNNSLPLSYVIFFYRNYFHNSSRSSLTLVEVYNEISYARKKKISQRS